jgi:hypothetical protein
MPKRKKNPKRAMPPALKRYWAARNKRIKNPRKRRRNPVQTQHLLFAQKPGGPVLKYTGGVKFARAGKAVRFADKAAANTVGASLKRQFPVLRPYRVWTT